MNRRRLYESWWILLTLVPFGMTAWVALVYAGVRARRAVWVGFGLVYFGMLAAGFWLIDEEKDAGLRDDIAATLWGLSWLLPFVHSLVIRNAYLERRFGFAGRLEAAEGRVEEREEARRLARDDPRRALEMGVGRPDRDGFSGGVVDLNNAPAAVLEELPGVNRELAERIVAVREEIDGFSSLEDMGHVLDLPATLLDRVRRDVVLLPRGTP